MRVVSIDDFDVEVGPARRMVFFRYADRPGIIGKVGTIFGEAGINIATMDVGRRAAGRRGADGAHRRLRGARPRLWTPSPTAIEAKQHPRRLACD